MAIRPPRERLRDYLRVRSKVHPRLRELQEQAAWVASVSTVEGLIAWLEAREDLGLLDSPQLRYAHGVVAAAMALINEYMDAQLPPKPPRRTWAEQLALLNERETQRRLNDPPVGYRFKPKHPPVPPAAERQRSMLERMAAAWERLADRGQAE